MVKWKYFDFEMGPRVQQKVSLINYYFMKLIFILDTNSFLYLNLHELNKDAGIAKEKHFPCQQ